MRWPSVLPFERGKKKVIDKRIVLEITQNRIYCEVVCRGLCEDKVSHPVEYSSWLWLHTDYNWIRSCESILCGFGSGTLGSVWIASSDHILLRVFIITLYMSLIVYMRRCFGSLVFQVGNTK